MKTRVQNVLCLACLLLAACGPGGNQQPALAELAHVAAVAQAPGATPFIATLTLGMERYDDLKAIGFTISPKPGTYSRPVTVSYDKAWLDRKHAWDAASRQLEVTVFGLYANYGNDVLVSASFADGSVAARRVGIATPAYGGPGALYLAPTIRTARTAHSEPGFDFIYLQNGMTTPVVIDTDGNLRWAGTFIANSIPSIYTGDGFYVGNGSPPDLYRVEFDGSYARVPVAAANYTQFHHDIAPGKAGMLAEMDARENGVDRIESILAEIAPGGQVLRQWDMSDIFRSYMLAHGDDPANFVRDGVDWFHMNSAIYVPQDDSLIVSSRENFVAKLDYATGSIKWLLGDTTKHWYADYPSLRALALTVAGGTPPVGQHALSVAPDGNLLMFNNGTPSFNAPAGTSPGVTLASSTAAKYRIDEAARSATLVWSYQHQPAIVSDVCSSVYQAGADRYLVSYASADSRTRADVLGTDGAGNVAFEFEYPTKGCGTAFIANPINFEALSLK